MSALAAPTRRTLAIGLVLLGGAGAAAVWALLAIALDRQCAWMALFAAADAVLLARMARLHGGWGRACLAVAATLLAVALANWWIAGAQIGQMLGLLPWQAIPRMGWSYGWTLASLANGTADLAWYAAAALLAAFAAR